MSKPIFIYSCLFDPQFFMVIQAHLTESGNQRICTYLSLRTVANVVGNMKLAFCCVDTVSEPKGTFCFSYDPSESLKTSDSH